MAGGQERLRFPRGPDRAEQLKARLGLRAVARRLVGELAHGQRQWVEIGMVVAREPR